ncbi:MAG: hypothetical protein KatS3mg104_0786 [Phycisphaerae bacterium]|jgi:BirA family biotin operon repressor/biotin-[acetyl-CoA-carboxylase] ligase|nr:MAG: hypothetical protein KatS3mg104_0786 [Phycisphaerae bacterium]
MNRFSLVSLQKAIRPFRLHFYPRLGSTNDQAIRLRNEGRLYCPAVILTGHQLAGRGRGSNRWWSGRGSLTVTFAVPVVEHLPAHHVPLLAGLAVRRALATWIPDLKLKWPNDLWYDSLKLAGLLCERVRSADMIGIGLNVNTDLADINPVLKHKVTSLQVIVGESIPVQEVLIAISRQLNRLLFEREIDSFRQVLPEYLKHHVLNGKRLRITEPGERVLSGFCEGVDAQGCLLLRSGMQLHRILAGHVEIASPSTD